jgi:hypothetical protein
MFVHDRNEWGGRRSRMQGAGAIEAGAQSHGAGREVSIPDYRGFPARIRRLAAVRMDRRRARDSSDSSLG